MRVQQLAMKIRDAARAYLRLWFPRVPSTEQAVDADFVVSFVKEHAQGNVSLQSGKFLTRSAHDKMIRELENHRFSA